MPSKASLSARDRARESLLIDLRHEIDGLITRDWRDDFIPALSYSTVYLHPRHAAHIELWEHDEGGADGDSFLVTVGDEYEPVEVYARKPRIEGDDLVFDLEMAE